MPKLERFSEKSNKPTTKQILIAAGIIVLLLGAFVFYKSFAFYKENKSDDVVKAKIGNYKKDIYVSYDNTNTGLDCTDTKCAIDEISDMLGE